MYLRIHALGCAVVVFALLSGCATRSPNEPLAQTSAFVTALSDTAQVKRKVLLLPPDVNLFELSAGGQRERVPEWSAKARQHIDRALRDALHPSSRFEIVDTPTLNEAEQSALDEHVALYARVGSEAFAKTNTIDAAWMHKRSEFDYTLGSGLDFLKDRSNADIAILSVASDTYRSAGNKALTALVMVAGAAAGVAIIPGSVPAFMSVGLVNMRSGQIEWLNFSSQGTMTDMREADGAKSLVSATFKPLLQPAAIAKPQ